MDNKSIIILLFILIILLALVCINSACINSACINSACINSACINGGRIFANKLNPISLTRHTHKLTFSIFGDDGLDYTVLKKLLNSWFRELPNNSPYADLSWGVYDIGIKSFSKDFYVQKANLKSIFNASDTNKFTNKHLLPFTAKNYNKNLLQFLPTSQLLTDVKSTNGEILIVKAGVDFGQYGIQVITNDKELHEAKKKFNPHKTIVSKYIKNPLLWKGKKFHLRPFILVYYNALSDRAVGDAFSDRAVGDAFSNQATASQDQHTIPLHSHYKRPPAKTGIQCFVYHTYHRVLTARQDYKQSDWLNSEIHLSGGKNTVTNTLNWPDGFDLPEELMIKCKHSLNKCIHEICTLIEEVYPKPYSESNSAFELFGPDIMIDDTGKAWLLEINKKCGFGRLNIDEPELWDAYNKKRSLHFFSWVLNTVVIKYFGYEHNFNDI